jgi:hypothetical protein
MDGQQNDDLAHRMSHDGYAVVRNFFDAAEIARLREIVAAHFKRRGNRHNLGQTQPNAAIEVPDLSWLYSMPKVINLFRQALATDDVVFTCHCDIHNSMLSGWHKDSGESRGGYFHGDYFRAEDCKVYKMAVYLQDHYGTGDGLSVRAASHHDPNRTVGKEVAIDTRSGDVILFDVRLTHAGQRPSTIERALMRMNGILGGTPDKNDVWPVYAARKLYCRLRGASDRLSIFFTFGYPNEFTEQFSRANMLRQIEQNGGKAGVLPADLVQGFGRSQVKIFSERPADRRFCHFAASRYSDITGCVESNRALFCSGAASEAPREER